MRKALAGFAAVALVAGGAWFVAPRGAGAQGGGTVEVEVKYNGAPQVETLKVNKDTEQCGKEEKFEKPEFVKVTCDVHSWMLGWVAVMPHPYFGVTDGSGVAKIENAPAGKQTIEVWHETLGKATKDVDVKPGQTTKVTIEMAKK